MCQNWLDAAELTRGFGFLRSCCSQQDLTGFAEPSFGGAVRGETSGEAKKIEPGPFPSKPGLKCRSSLKSVSPSSRVQIEIQPLLCFDGPC